MFAIKQVIKFFLFVVIFSSCNPGISKEGTIGEYILDTVRIAIDENYLQQYTVVQNQVVGEFLYAFNTKEHSIDIFNLKTRQVAKQLILHKEGPDGIPSVSSFYVTPSFIVLENQYQYVIMSWEGQIKLRLLKENVDMPESAEDYIITSQICISNFESMAFDESREELIIPLYPKIPYNYKNTNSIATLNIGTNELSILSTPSPVLLESRNFGLLSKPYMISKGDSIIYNYPFSSHVYIYDRTTNSLSERDVPSSYSQRLSEPFEEKTNTSLLDHYFHSTFYHGLKYDIYRNLYYRIHINKSSDPSVFNNREAYLTVMDHDFQKIEEIPLRTNTYPIYNITPDGLVFEFMQALEEDYYSYMLLTTDKIPVVAWPDSLMGRPEYTTESGLTETVLAETRQVAKTANDYFDMSVFDNGHIGFVYKHLKYPDDEYKKGIEGSVMVILERDEKGYIIHYDTLAFEETVTTAMKEEALRIIKQIKRVNPEVYEKTLGFQVLFDIKRYNEANNI